MKRAKTPTQTTSLKNPVISLLKPAHALPNAVFTINNSSKVIRFHLQGGNPTESNNRNHSPQLPHNSVTNTHQLWSLKRSYLLPK